MLMGLGRRQSVMDDGHEIKCRDRKHDVLRERVPIDFPQWKNLDDAWRDVTSEDGRISSGCSSISVFVFMGGFEAAEKLEGTYMKAYVTLLSTESYLPGVFGLFKSLQQVKSAHPLWVGVSSSIPREVEEVLRERGMHVTRLPEGITIPSSLKEKSGHWAHTFDKLHVFGLISFSKLVYVDSDMMVMKNIDELFEKPHMSAVAAGRLVNPSWERLNSGLMVIEPELGLPQRIAGALQKAQQEIASLGNEAIGDQDLINAYYSDWPGSAKLHLDEGYNVFHEHADAYIDEHGYRLLDSGDDELGAAKLIRVVHFIGRDKPWMKWAAVRHFSNTFRRMSSTKWERKVFKMYRKVLEQNQPSI
jgi:glycogenin glucosyltransferase